MDETLKTRLRELCDKEEIHEVLLRYARGIDRRDRDLILASFHPDATVGAGTGEELAEYMLRLAPEDPCYTHYICNQLIELDGDKAYSETYFISIWELEYQGDWSTRFRGGRYIDQFERRDGVWKIAHRDAVDDWDRLDAIKQRARGLGSHAHEVHTDPEHRGSVSPADIVFHIREPDFGRAPVAYDHSWQRG
jgi:hypothetical protein